MTTHDRIDTAAIGAVERRLAAEGRDGLRRLADLGAQVHSVKFRVQDVDVDVPVPSLLTPILISVLREIAKGHGVRAVATHAELSTQEAAGILGVSRPHVIGLAESGAIPFTKVGKHRRMRLEDVLNYRERMSAPRAAAAGE